MTGAQRSSPYRSAYHEQWELGFPGLRFQKRIEDEFRFVNLQSRMAQLRVSLLLAMVAVSALYLADLPFDEHVFDAGTSLRRALLVEGVLIGVLLLSFDRRLARHLPAFCAIGALLAGLAVLLVRPSGTGVIALFPGCFILTVYVYFLLGLRWLPALVTGAALLAGFALTAVLHGTATAPFLNTFLLLAATNAVGAWGLYDLELNRRRNFLKSKMLGFLVERDPLTGLCNRKALDRLFADAWTQCRAEQRPIAVAIVDVDHFKAYNDTYGHQAGDRCLTGIARQLECASRRPRDTVGRYGGEEFLIVLPEATEYYALVLLDSIRDKIHELGLPHASARDGVVTVSIGVACCRPHEEALDGQALLNVADQALYSAKSQGRNRVVLGLREASERSPRQSFGDRVSVAVTTPV